MNPPSVDEPPGDIAALAREFHAAVVGSTPSWVRRGVVAVAGAQQLPLPENFEDLIEDAGARAARYVEAHLGELLEADIDRQQTTPLAVIRDAVRFPVEVLHQLGATQVHRLDMERWAFPNDPFGLTPASLADLDETVHHAGLVWGATKAGLHLQRRRAEGVL